jgi:diamine N-acetyltransferase
LVTLIELNADNWRECVALQVAEDQNASFSSNLYRIAQSKFERSLIPYAIYNKEGTMVGFVVYGHKYKPVAMEREPEGHWSLVHLMVDRNHQRKGYGRSAVEEVIKRVKESGKAEVLSLSYAPDNTVARRLYARLGFQETGEMNGGELVARLWITRR